MLYLDLEKSAELYPTHQALSCGNNRMTYEQLIDQVDRLASGLSVLAGDSGSRVALCLYNTIDFVICLYALSKKKYSVVLLNPLSKDLDIEESLKVSGAQLLITENRIYKQLQQLRPHMKSKYSFVIRNGERNQSTVLAELFDDQSYDEDVPTREWALDDECLVQCSSGTTGLAKLALRTATNLSEDIGNIISTFGYASEDKIYCSVPLSHGYGLTMGLIAPIRVGASIHIEKWFMPNRFLGEYEYIRPTIFLGTPEIYESIIFNRPQNFKGFFYTRWLFSSSSPISKAIGYAFYEDYGAWIHQLYGMMEVSTICANLSPSYLTYTSVGVPVKNVKIKIDGSPGLPGEILVQSLTISNYIVTTNGNISENPSIEEGWFRTGDFGYIDQDEVVWIIGRINEIEKEKLG